MLQRQSDLGEPYLTLQSLVVGDAQGENLDFDEFYVLTKQILELVFEGLAVVMKRLLYDHLEGGKYHGKEEDYQAEPKNVPTTNAQSERDFGMLDGTMKTMPRATGLAVEGLVMCRTNKPQFWRDSLGEKDLASTMELARRSKQRQQQENKERMAAIYEIRMRKLEANKNEKTKKKQN